MAISGKGASLDRFNASLRADPEYRAFLRSMGVDPDAPVRLNGSQRAAAERWVQQRYAGQVAGKMQIDPAGNVNTDHGLSTAWSNPYFRYPLIAGGALGTAGALGAFGGAGGAAGGGAGTAGAAGGSTIPAWMTGAAAPAIASQGISQTMGRTGGNALGSILGKIGGGVGKFFTSKEGVASLASLIPALMALKGSGPFGGGGDGVNRGMDLAENAYKDAQRLNAMKETRFRRVDPLHEAVTQLAFNRLPNDSREGIDLTRIPLPK